jgi:hypothetical protein
MEHAGVTPPAALPPFRAGNHRRLECGRERSKSGRVVAGVSENIEARIPDALGQHPQNAWVGIPDAMKSKSLSPCLLPASSTRSCWRSGATTVTQPRIPRVPCGVLTLKSPLPCPPVENLNAPFVASMTTLPVPLFGS